LIPDRPARDDHLGLHLHRLDGSRLVLHVVGELDRFTAPVLVAFVEERLGCEPPGTDLAIDLTATSFVDVGGLNALLHVQRRVGTRGIAVHVGPCRTAFLRLLRLTRTVGLTAS
jgi:anti-anti-sigma factor